MLVKARSFTTPQRLHSFKFTLVNKSHSQHSEAVVCCLGRHFLILYACAHEVSFPDPRSRFYTGNIQKLEAGTAWEQGSTHGWHGLSPTALGKAYEHHVGKGLHSAAYL